MKKLIFIRHGRAEEQGPGITDFERSLTIKGKVICREMAERLIEKEKDPGLIITSPAFRALETAFIFASEYGIDFEKIRIDSDLYYRDDMKHFMELLHTVSEQIETITVFGHNPSITEIPDRLCRDGCEFLTKTSIACISFQIRTWSELKTDTGKQEYLLKPVK
ncbi:MAG TPA: histidine phosphatase family protein [Bacteroidales bacterium]|nr:histidine phosphatase family protein [Bacteroidales bacterium]HOX73884.1 histidine phosphatase family protein [Bacteroidales bacterium]HPM87222.1 histidine phosphatase family protein [Bacteroidales bacterium]HQM69203.1 histidine phosphatase family protein [Bacteroidales bacterium]